MTTKFQKAIDVFTQAIDISKAGKIDVRNEANRITNEFMDKQPWTDKGRLNTGAYRSGNAVANLHFTEARVRHVSSGEPRKVNVMVASEPTKGAEGGRYFQAKNGSHEVHILIPEHLQHKDAIRNHVSAALHHELTHAADHGMRPSDMRRYKSSNEFRHYVNQPSEVAAHISQIAHEASSNPHPEGIEQTIKNTPRFKRIGPHLDIKNRKRTLLAVSNHLLKQRME